MAYNSSVYDLIKEGEAKYVLPVEVIEGWNWNMKEHIRRAFLYFNSQFASRNDKRDTTPFKNIIRFILNVAFRLEGFNVKDIHIFADDQENYFKSFLLRKFHEKWAKDNQIDTFIDELIESTIIYGGALVKNVKGVRPEVVDLASICFADQTNLLDNPFGIKHLMSIEELQAMSDSGWGVTANGATISLDQLIELTREEQSKYNGKIEIYEVHGVLPESWIDDKKQESKKYIRQVQICAYYKNQDNNDVGVTLFKSKSPKKLFKLLKRDEIKNRALGFGGVEELFDAQVWTNYAMIRKRDFLDSASKTLLKTTDSGLVSRHPSGLKDVDNLEVIEVAEGKDINQIDTAPRNFQFFNEATTEWEEHGKKIGSAPDSLLGIRTSKVAIPFRAQNQQISEAGAMHEYRKEKFARFVEELYQDWIMPQLAREVISGATFMSELGADELESISENMKIKESNDFIKEEILNGNLIDATEVEQLKANAKAQFLKDGNKKFIEIIKDEFKDVSMSIKIVIADKAKDLDALNELFKTIASAPQILQIPNIVQLLNPIIEESGLSPINFTALTQPQPVPQANPAQGQTPPQQAIPQQVVPPQMALKR